MKDALLSLSVNDILHWILTHPIWFLGSLMVFLISARFVLLQWTGSSKKKVNLADRWVVITGCDTGFGLGSTAALAQACPGVKIISICLTKEGCDKALSAGAADAIQCDVSNSAALISAANKISTLCKGELWAVVHNAGIARAGFADFQTMENYRKVFDVNFFSVVQLNQLLMPYIKKTKGRVVVVSSVCGLVSLPGNAPYAASKHAIEALATTFRIEYGKIWGVHFAVINPGTMRTALSINFFDSMRETWRQREKETLDDTNAKWKVEYSKEWLDAYIESSLPTFKSGMEEPKCAIDDIVHAVSAANPKSRYLSGMVAKTLWYAIWSLPESWSLRFRQDLIKPAPFNVSSR